MWLTLGTRTYPILPEIITTAFTVLFIYSIPSSIVDKKVNYVPLNVFLNFF